MEIRNPITDAGALAVDGNRFPEQRIQELLDCWFSDRFTGEPITVDALAQGATEERTFTKCDIAWGEAAVSKTGDPLIHLHIIDHSKDRRATRPRTVQHRHRWLVQAMIKFPRNPTGSGKVNPDQVVRRVAAEIEWLIASPEKLALATVGVEHVKITGPAVPIATAQWQARVLVIECYTRSEAPRQG